MKNKIAIASAFIAASSFSTAEIVINDFLSFEGFVDMSYSHVDADADNLDIQESDNSFAVDQVEISWLFDFDPVTAQIDLQYDEGTDSETAVEQAFATYHLGNGGAITAGRYASMIGFEAFEPTGLYQYSFAYDLHIPGIDTGIPLNADPLSTYEASVGDVTIIPGYANGVKFTYETDTTFFGISLQDEVFGNDGDRLGGDNDSSYGGEVAFSITMENGLSWFLGGAYEDADLGDSYMLNTYVTFETGAWIFAAELSYGESESNGFAVGATLADADDKITGGALLGGVDTDEEVLQALIMANFAYSDQASVTGRISYVDHEYDVAGAGTIAEVDALKFTLAHGYAFTDNLFLVNEISYVETGLDTLIGDEDIDSIFFAAELIFSF